jgi:hypothetical protein
VIVAGGPATICVTPVCRISCLIVPDDELLADVVEIVFRVPPAEILISRSPKVVVPSVDMMGAPPLVRCSHQISGATAPGASTPVVGQNESLK